MIGMYKLEILGKAGWQTTYEGNDMGQYLKATMKASIAGDTTRATCIGRSGARPGAAE